MSDIRPVTYVPFATADVVALLIKWENAWDTRTWRLVLALKRYLVTGDKFLSEAEVVTSRRRKSSNGL